MATRAEIRTARLTLRPVAASDEAAVVAALSDLGVTGWLAVVPHPYGAEDFRRFLEEMAFPGETYAVADDDGLAGIVGAGHELGYWLAPRAQGRGYATEAVRAILAEQLADDPADIASGYFEGNARSAAVLRKMGFVETGRRMKFCRALGIDRPHVDMRLTWDGFRAALPWQGQSARLRYRDLQAVDVAALHGIVGQRDVTRQLGPAWPWPADPAFTLTRAQPFLGEGFLWGAFLGERLAGSVGVTRGELGYMVDPALQRQGLAREGCKHALAHAFGTLGLAHVTAGVWADNAASLSLLTALGFQVTGESLGTSALRPEPAAGLTLILTRQAWEAAR